jgi:ACS family tartrate transporter-like MFS transporter
MPARYRAGAVAISMLAIPTSVIIGGPLCGWLMSSQNALALSGWRWMFFIEGVATSVLGACAYLLFVNEPSEARWLTMAEKDWLSAALAQDEAGVTEETPLRRVLGDNRVWLAAAIWCTTLVGANGMIFWLPQAIKQMTSLSDVMIGFVSTLPWLGVAGGMLLNSWHSDRQQERFWHLSVPLLIAAGALVVASLTPIAGIALLLLFLSGFALGSGQGVFWAVPTTFLGRSLAAAGITLINLVGNLGSLVGPYVIGWIRSHSATFAAPVWFVAVVLGCGALLVIPLRRAVRRRH